MPQDNFPSVVPLLAKALQRIRSTPPRIIASPPTQPRRAAVALLIRVVPAPNAPLPSPSTAPPSLTDFFEQDWVNHPDARPEILFLHREDSATPETAVSHHLKVPKKEAHAAFPGGRMEPDDESGSYTAMRQTWEEVGIDLAERYYTYVGQLDDREITTSLGKRLLMILSPFVFLQVTPSAPQPDPIPTISLHWTPLSSLVSPYASQKWSTVSVDAASRLTPKNSTALRLLVRILVGSMEFPAIVLQSTDPSNLTTNEKSKHDVLEKGIPPIAPQKRPKNLKLWGLSLGMTLDLMSYMIHPAPTLRTDGLPTSGSSSPLTPVMQLPYHPSEDFLVEYVAPSLASVFPKFSYPDVNFWIWVFGRRYRQVVRGWEASLRAGVNDRRINWSGSALNNFYASIRKALVVVIVARALGILIGLGFAIWWIFAT